MFRASAAHDNGTERNVFKKFIHVACRYVGEKTRLLRGGGGEGGVIPSVTLKIGRTSWSALSSVPARRTQHIFALMKNALDIINFKFSVLSF